MRVGRRAPRGGSGGHRSRARVLRRLAAAAAFCTGMTEGQDAELKAAVDNCVAEDATGACACAGTSCSTDSRFQGPIGTWDVSGVTDMMDM